MEKAGTRGSDPRGAGQGARERNLAIGYQPGRGWHLFPPPPPPSPRVSSGRRRETAAVVATSRIFGSFLFALNSVRIGARSSRAEVAAPRRRAEGEGVGRPCAAPLGWARAEAAA